ncbi:hypothetical protein MtrunA17_Chr4g0060661 [Medicago truncatula]|uniref:Uncharacterized protein n=1 Tax=Medicago truncatula TaxID=3880 RepID=A0A396IFS5_MEDTR|nr:hypothetical protein MtrunA17_Chr4g0060661 [Medicago truncatula]
MSFTLHPNTIEFTVTTSKTFRYLQKIRLYLQANIHEKCSKWHNHGHVSISPTFSAPTTTDEPYDRKEHLHILLQVQIHRL